MALSPLSRNNPVVDQDGKPLQSLNLFSEEVARRHLLIGDGDPDGVVESTAPRLYVRADGPPWLYVKPVNSVAGDRKAGWEAV